MTPEEFTQTRETLCPDERVTASRECFADMLCISVRQVIRIEKHGHEIQPQTEKIIELLLAIHNTKTGKQFGV